MVNLLLIVGDLNADPAVIPCLAKGISTGRFVDLALAYSILANLGLMSVLDLGDFIVGCSTACRVTDGWFHSSFFLSIGRWTADVACPEVCQPIWPACWIHTPNGSSSSVARTLQDAWDIELGLVLPDVVLVLRDAVSRSCVDDFGSVWSKSAEAGLCGAYCWASGPTEAGSFAFLGRGLLRIRSRRLGGRAVGRSGASKLYRVNSSLAPVLLFRTRLKSVADVLKGIRNNGFTQARWEALLRYWDAVCRHGPCGPILCPSPLG